MKSGVSIFYSCFFRIILFNFLPQQVFVNILHYPSPHFASWRLGVKPSCSWSILDTLNSGSSLVRLDTPGWGIENELMDESLARLWLETKAEVSFSRSSGPGGQNVNKVNSKSTIFVDIRAMEGLTDLEKIRAMEKLAPRLTTEGILVIQVQDDRSQLMNRETAVDRVLAVLKQAIHRDRPRRATKPTKASKERRLTAKKISSSHRKNRSVGED